MDCSPPSSSIHGLSQTKNTGVGCHFLLQEIFPTQDKTYISCIGRQILYQWAIWEAKFLHKQLKSSLDSEENGTSEIVNDVRKLSPATKEKVK